MLCISPNSVSPQEGSRPSIKMLREYKSPSDQEEALALTAPVPDLLPIHAFLKHSLQAPNRYNGRLRLFSSLGAKPQYWFALITSLHERPAILLFRDAEPAYEQKGYQRALSMFLTEVAKIVEGANEIGTVSENILNYELVRLLPTFLPSHSTLSRTPYHLFYMNKEQLKRLDLLELPLPYGYRFDAADNDEDCRLIAETSDGTLSEETARERLSTLPSVLIRGPGGATVTHELTSPASGLTHLFTHPDHRRRGLATAAELKLAQQNAALGCIPFKGVSIYATSISKSSEESPFWTMLHRGGTPVEMVHHAFALEPQSDDNGTASH